MNDLLTGSMPSWLSAAATALSPLVALLAGFVGADQWFRRLLGQKDYHAPAAGVEEVKCANKLRPLPRSAG
ncbi:MAG: hypothetical protein JO110_27360 [Acetobacteraceae bacterium]|nr:hypothetical protein [Acetobacteraceae bacterium]